jgi:hypothetical protein
MAVGVQTHSGRSFARITVSTAYDMLPVRSPLLRRKVNPMWTAFSKVIDRVEHGGSMPHPVYTTGYKGATEQNLTRFTRPTPIC